MMLKVMCLGDIVGRPGRLAIKEYLPNIQAAYGLDLVIANGENASGGRGLVPETARELSYLGIDVITLGDHTWQRRECRDYLENSSTCIRPANYPLGGPGKGWTIITVQESLKVGIMNLLGRVFIGGALDCPFARAMEILSGPLKDCPVIICDFHAEATSEKVAMARYLDGQVSLVCGTHSHIPTADEQVLPEGTGYITDLGMCGSSEGVLGMDAAVSLERFLTGIPAAYKLAKGSPVLQGAIAEIDPETGRSLSINRVSASTEGCWIGKEQIA